MSVAPDLKQVADLVFSTEVRKYIGLACLTLYTYDTVSLLPAEVKLIWSARWSIPKVLYLLTRYLPLVTYTVSVYYGFYQRDWTDSACLAVNRYLAWMIYICMFFPEIIFAIRTWAVWGRGVWMGVFLAVFTGGTWLATFTILYINIESMQPLPIPKYIRGPGCVAISQNKLGSSTLVTALILLFYGVSFPLMLIRMIRQYNASFSDLWHATYFLRTVYVDGLLYYFYLMLISMGTVIINTRAPPAYVGLLSQPQQTLAGLLACRMLLELRSYQFRALRREVTEIPLSTEFATRDMGTIMFRRPASSAGKPEETELSDLSRV